MDIFDIRHDLSCTKVHTRVTMVKGNRDLALAKLDFKSTWF